LASLPPGTQLHATHGSYDFSSTLTVSSDPRRCTPHRPHITVLCKIAVNRPHMHFPTFRVRCRAALQVFDCTSLMQPQQQPQEFVLPWPSCMTPSGTALEASRDPMHRRLQASIASCSMRQQLQALASCSLQAVACDDDCRQALQAVAELFNSTFK
jgi:hypothetical protein